MGAELLSTNYPEAPNSIRLDEFEP